MSENAVTLTHCVCGQCFYCPDGYHRHEDELPCGCTPDCLFGDDGPCPKCGLHSLVGGVCKACGENANRGPWLCCVCGKLAVPGNANLVDGDRFVHRGCADPTDDGKRSMRDTVTRFVLADILCRHSSLAYWDEKADAVIADLATAGWALTVRPQETPA